MNKIRGFEIVERYRGKLPILPILSTGGSAGHDFFALDDYYIYPTYTLEFVEQFGTKMDIKFHKPVIIPTGIKSYMLPDEYLAIENKSGLSTKYNLMFVNGRGIIDSDYYNCKGKDENDPCREGHIQLAFYNFSNEIVHIKKGQAIVQGIFHKYYKADGDNKDTIRNGGFGHTDNISIKGNSNIVFSNIKDASEDFKELNITREGNRIKLSNK